MQKQRHELHTIALAYLLTVGGGIPSGHLYAQFIARVTLDQHQAILAALKDVGAITEEGHFVRLTEHGDKMAAAVRADLNAGGLFA